MNYIKLLISLFGILLIFILAYYSLEREEEIRVLKKSNEIVEAKIIKLNSSLKNNHIKFKFEGKEFRKRIRVTGEEYKNLVNQDIIQIKVDEKQNIVFAEESYNDNSKTESIATIFLAVILSFFIFWYSIKPTIVELGKNKK